MINSFCLEIQHRTIKRLGSRCVHLKLVTVPVVFPLPETKTAPAGNMSTSAQSVSTKLLYCSPHCTTISGCWAMHRTRWYHKQHFSVNCSAFKWKLRNLQPALRDKIHFYTGIGTQAVDEATSACTNYRICGGKSNGVALKISNSKPLFLFQVFVRPNSNSKLPSLFQVIVGFLIKMRHTRFDDIYINKYIRPPGIHHSTPSTTSESQPLRIRIFKL